MREQEIKDLRHYIELLLRLADSGFKCEREMKVALLALHKAMGFEKE